MKSNYTPCYQFLRICIALICGHYNPILIQHLRQYLHRYAFMRRATRKAATLKLSKTEPGCLHFSNRNIFDISVTYSIKLRSLVQYTVALCNPLFLHFRPILINLSEVVSKLSSNGNESFSIGQ
ncbi:hypothetical protein T11_87 [Trichinella zimbabwensis]|uniref:Uncharacterized protein n=1 Tax=Trichinella zimbabwensis TaxID=268475 RepID=A0A0V1GLV6_9BILA|nr:hypothetical protein T11_87 [Trichinella zimbabwensis]